MSKRQRILDFDAAWDAAWRSVRWEAATVERRASKQMLEEQRPLWEAAFLDLADVPGGKTLVALAEALHDEPGAFRGDVGAATFGDMVRVAPPDLPRRSKAA